MYVYMYNHCDNDGHVIASKLEENLIMVPSFHLEGGGGCKQVFVSRSRSPLLFPVFES